MIFDELIFFERMQLELEQGSESIHSLFLFAPLWT